MDGVIFSTSTDHDVVEVEDNDNDGDNNNNNEDYVLRVNQTVWFFVGLERISYH